MSSVIAASGQFNIHLPAWGRSFWQDPNDGELFLAFVSGNSQAYYVRSVDSGVTWQAPRSIFPVDNFSVQNNFDTEMDENGNVHCLYRYNESGCYTILGKSATGWAPSGEAIRGFVATSADDDVARGIQGMVSVYNIFQGDPGWWTSPASDTSQLSARIVIKDNGNVLRAYRVPESGTFSSYPIEDQGFSALTKPNPGGNGGFPIFTDAGGNNVNFRAPAVTYAISTTGIAHVVRTSSFSSTWGVANSFEIDSTATTYTAGTPGASGYSGRVLFNPNMSFDRAVSPTVHPIIATTDNGQAFIGIDIYSTALEQDILDAPSDNFFGRIDQSSSRVIGATDPVSRDPVEIDIIGSLTQGGMPVPVAGRETEFWQGTSTDITHGDEPRTHILYFQSRDPAGQQVISRVPFRTIEQNSDNDGNTPRQTRYIFGPAEHPASGIRSFAPAGLDYTGGDGLAIWKGFKGLHHPTQPGAGVSKQEIVATIGSGINQNYKLIAWDWTKSVEYKNSLKVPTYSRFLTKDSGTSPTFELIEVFGPTYTVDKVNQLFDGDLTTDVSMDAGDGFTLRFDKPIIISRAEFIRDFSSSVGVDVSGSLDNINYYRIVAMDGGNALHKYSAEYDFPPDIPFTIDEAMEPYAAEYVRVVFTRMTGTRSITELRLFGPHTTAGKTTTGPGKTTIGFEGPPEVIVPQDFSSLAEGQLPAGWRNTGDWNWGAQTSGIYAKSTTLPSEPAGDGSVKVGQFAGNPIGNGNGFALRTQTGMPLNSSGVLEFDITIGSDELTEDGTSGRTIKWDTRYYLVATGVINGPEDDRLRFFVIPEGGAPTDGEVIFYTQGCFINVCDWYTVKTNVSPGNYTLKWAFERKNLGVSSPFPGEEAVAWIDNVEGTSSVPIAAINGFLSSQNVISESIHGYIDNPYQSWIRGYMDVENPFEPINGYIVGQPDAFNSINGYVLGMKQGQVNAYTIAGGGLRSFPTGVIHGFVARNSGVVSPAINGYLLGMKQGQVRGYMYSLGSETGNVDGYLNADYHFSSILGRLGPSGDVGTSQVFGYLPAFAYSSINGYLINAGGTSQVYGYLSPQKSSFINAYLTTPPSGDNAQVYGYLANSGVIAPAINAWISGASVFTPINGYLINEGATTQVHGYLNVHETSQVNGYIHGRSLTSGLVNAYMSGLGFENIQVNAYMFGVSGIAQTSINGYMLGADVDTEVINGYLTGYQDVCNAHGIPLPTVPTGFVIPTDCFNFGV